MFAMGTFVLQTELDPERKKRIADETYVEQDHYDKYTLQVWRGRLAAGAHSGFRDDICLEG